MKQSSCNKGERKLARTLATEIFEVAETLEIPGNPYQKIQKLNLKKTFSLTEKVWLSDFQSDNEDCPLELRELILISFKSNKEKRKKKKMMFNKIKSLIVRKDNNKNTPNVSQKKENIILKTILYPICYIWVNTIYIVTYTKNYVIVIIGTASIHLINTTLKLPMISNTILLTLLLIGVTFLNSSVYKKNGELDLLESLLEIISTPKILLRFKYAKRMSRLHWKQTQYIQRKNK